MAYLAHYGRKGMKWGQHIFKDDDLSKSAYERLVAGGSGVGQENMFNISKKKQNAMSKKFAKASYETGLNKAQERYKKASENMKSKNPFTYKKRLNEYTDSRMNLSNTAKTTQQLFSMYALDYISTLPKKERAIGARYCTFLLWGD